MRETGDEGRRALDSATVSNWFELGDHSGFKPLFSNCQFLISAWLPLDHRTVISILSTLLVRGPIVNCAPQLRILFFLLIVQLAMLHDQRQPLLDLLEFGSIHDVLVPRRQDAGNLML